MVKAKPNVIVLTRVSTEEQDLERQRDLKNSILQKFGLNQIDHKALKVSGTIVQKTTDYKEAMATMRRPDCNGMVVPALDRWFRLKQELLTQWALALAEYVKPFEVVNPDGKTAKI